MAHTLTFQQIDDLRACMDDVASGTVPNKYGKWWYGRAGFCPGRDVPAVVTDVTADVTAGGEVVIEYEGLHDGAPYSGTGASIYLTSALLISE